MPVSGAAPEKVQRNNLDEKMRHRLIEHLLSGSTEGKLGRGDIQDYFFPCLRPRIALFRLFLKVAYIICIPNVAYIFCRTGRGACCREPPSVDSTRLPSFHPTRTPYSLSRGTAPDPRPGHRCVPYGFPRTVANEPLEGPVYPQYS